MYLVAFWKAKELFSALSIFPFAETGRPRLKRAAFPGLPSGGSRKVMTQEAESGAIIHCIP